MRAVLRLWIVAAAFVFLLPLFSRADVVGQLDRGGVQLYCVNAASVFDQGTWARSIGIARDLKQSPPGLPTRTASADEVPKESMYHPDWDQLTERDQAFFQKHIFAGYDAADGLVKDSGKNATEVLTKQTRDSMQEAYFLECLRTEAAARTYKKPSGDFKRTGSAKPLTEREASEMVMDSGTGAGDVAASSEGLLHQKDARAKECGELLTNEKIISLYAEKAWTEVGLHLAVDMAEDVADADRTALKKLISDAYAYEGGPDAYFKNAWNACMDGA